MKNKAFIDVLTDTRASGLTSIGDSVYEHEALEFVKLFKRRKVHRSIKFVANPSGYKLLEQHDRLTSNLQGIMRMSCDWYEVYT